MIIIRLKDSDGNDAGAGRIGMCAGAASIMSQLLDEGYDIFLLHKGDVSERDRLQFAATLSAALDA